MIEQLGGNSKVKSLTMLATPNWGTPLAYFPCALGALPLIPDDQAACDLRPLSPLIQALNYFPGTTAGVSYQVISGWLGLPGLLAAPNDCVVEAWSAQGPGFPLLLRPVLHLTGGLSPLVGCWVGTGIVESTQVRQDLVQILLPPALMSAGQGDGQMAGATPPPDSAASN